MGFIFSKLWRRLRGDRQFKVVLLGLANAGKTTILYRLQLGEVVSAHPTIGSNVEEFQHNNINLQVWDLGGQESLRPSWASYFTSADALIFVVDSADQSSFLIAKMELFNLILHPDVRQTPILVFANKQDLPVAMNAGEVSQQLNLISIRNHDWNIQPCSAMDGTGLYEGIDWLTEKLQGIEN